MSTNNTNMFTGIIRTAGTIKKIDQDKNPLALEIITSLARDKKKGDSIAVDGVCLTVTSILDDVITVDVVQETLNRTIIKNYREGSVVNLENPLKYGDSMDGHMVSGHVDYVSKIINMEMNPGEIILSAGIPANMTKYFAMKGSVTINGVSLTISNLNHTAFSVSLIPETLSNTNLGKLQKNDEINIEIDMIGRYLEALLNNKEKEVSYDFLKERGFL